MGPATRRLDFACAATQHLCSFPAHGTAGLRGRTDATRRQYAAPTATESGAYTSTAEERTRAAQALRGTPGRTRTCDPRIRSPTLYPAELRARSRRINSLADPSRARLGALRHYWGRTWHRPLAVERVHGFVHVRARHEMAVAVDAQLNRRVAEPLAYLEDRDAVGQQLQREPVAEPMQGVDGPSVNLGAL